MNIQRYVLKMSLLSVLLFGNAVLLGMKRKSDTTVALYQNPHTTFPVEIMIQIAAGGSGEVKNRLKETCGFFRKTFTKENIEFISHPSFTAHRKDIEDMVCSAAWFNNVQKEQALARFNVAGIIFDTSFEFNSLRPNCCVGLMVNELKLLRNDTSLTNASWEIEPAFCCAVRCNDPEAINNLAPKIKQGLSADFRTPIMEFHNCLLMQIIQKDREELFRVMLKNDPMNALNVYNNHSKNPNDQRPFLDVLINADYIEQDLKDKYSLIYRECGGKTLDELEAEKRQKQQQWRIIS